MNKPREQGKTWSPACFWDLLTQDMKLFFFFHIPKAGGDNPSWIRNIWPSHWFLETLLRLYHGLAELNWNQRWGEDGADGQRCHLGVEVNTFTVMVWFISKCMKFLPGDRFITRSLDLWTQQEAVQKFPKTSYCSSAISVCVRVCTVSVYTICCIIYSSIST